MSYRIPDEPAPSPISHLSVQPLWPLLAVMFGGAWLSWPWFAVNAFAIGSPNRVKEVLLVIGGFVGSAALAVTLAVATMKSGIDREAMRYAWILLTVWKLGVSYGLYSLQGRTFDLYEYYGGTVRNGLPIVFLGGFLGRRLVLGAIPLELWILVMG